MLKWIFRAVIGLVAAAAAIGAFVFWVILPPFVDNDMNPLGGDTLVVSDQAKALHEGLQVADLHADSLLWMRDPAQRHERGHLDLPRMQEGGIALQVFTAVTKSPSNLNYETNTGGTDNVTLLAIGQRWPRKTWGSLFERAIYQAQRLHELEEDAPQAFSVVRTSAQLDAALDQGKVAGMLGLEGLHPLEGELSNLQGLWDAGYRVAGLQHFFDNELGASLHGLDRNKGLTDFGKQVIAEMNAMGMIIDVAHSSPGSVQDVLDMTSAPVIISHTGMFGHCEIVRNISDELMQGIAATGGLIGIGFWPDVTCAKGVRPIAQAIAYAVELVGVDHVALGSDFDGTVETPFDAAGMVQLTQGLLDEGLSEGDITKIMGGNQIRFMRENLPGS